MSEMISIILPFYNVKREYMEACMHSIRNQTYQNWEVIIVDDGSEKSTAQWLDSYITPQVKVIHQKNAGVSVARTRGIQEAKGKWVYFCDPDDLMKENELEILYVAARNTESDIVVCRYATIDGNGNLLKVPQNDAEDVVCITDSDEIFFEVAAPRVMRDKFKVDLQKYSLVYPWAHLYRTECIKEICFPEGIHPGEDKVFNMIAYKKAKRIVLIANVLHLYRVGYGVTARYNTNALDNARKERKLVREILQPYANTQLYKESLAKLEADEMAYLMKNYFFHKDNLLCQKEKIKHFIEYTKRDIVYYPRYVNVGILTTKQIFLWIAVKTRMIYFAGLILGKR